MSGAADDFTEDDRRDSRGGRRVSDVPTVPLRDHLETLIRGVRTELHLETTTVAAKVDELRAQTAADHAEVKDCIQTLSNDLRALQEDRSERAGEGRVKARVWTLVVGAAAIAGSVSAVVSLAVPH